MTKQRKSVVTIGLNAEAKSEVRRMMHEAGWTRSMLARALGVNRVCVTQMLSPGRNLSLDTLEKLVRTLGYTVHLDCDKQIETRYRDDQ